MGRFGICSKAEGLFAKRGARCGNRAQADVSSSEEATNASIAVEAPNMVGF
jgi:hypothetical protein